MNDLISRISLKQSIAVSAILKDKKTLEQIIDEEPSIDAVPVVRCRDCIHSTSQVSDDEDNYYCNAMMRCMHSLDFCSYAERKES